MAPLPDYDTFAALAARYAYVPVCRRLTSDSLTPVSAFHRIDDGQTACLFESVVGGEKVGRFSFLTSHPFLEISARGTEVTVVAAGKTERFACDDPLQELRKRLSEIRVARLEGLPPFIGGAIGYAGYDVIRYWEYLPDAPEDDRRLPDMSFAFYDRMIVFDNVNKTLWVIVLAKIERPDQVRRAYDAARAEIDRLVNRLWTPPPHLLPPADIDTTGHPTIAYTSNFSPEAFRAAVRRCVEYINAGDIFQVVLSRRLAVPVACDPLEVYRTLRIVNPSPFMFFLRTPDTTLVGSSPEIMCRVFDGKVTVRPLAGTRPRGRDDAEDLALAEELLADPKERAEHVMLVDLGRNDVGRVAQYRSVEISDVMTVERYSHVMHITSNVTGMLRDGQDAFDALRACLPAGTVSGAPKVRAMEIIDELEPHRRGPYAGAVGYMDFGGNMDTCIALRTIVFQNGVAYVQSGAGIVADSDPEKEYQETLNKARGLLKAIEMTEQREREIS